MNKPWEQPPQEHQFRPAALISPLRDISPAPVRSRRQLREHITALAEDRGFHHIRVMRSGAPQLAVRIRVKYFQKYGNPPATKCLLIPGPFVNALFRIYQTWPELAEFLLSASLWHECHHYHHDLTSFADLDSRETLANCYMFEKMGTLSLIVSLWYVAAHRKNGTWNRHQKPLSEQSRSHIAFCLENLYPDLIPPHLHEHAIDAVLALEHQYRQRR